MKLNRKVRGSWWVGIAAFLLLTPFVFSQTVDLTLDNGGNNIMNGVYVGPYNATQSVNNQNPQSAQIICDDFSHDVVAGESWRANVTSVSALTTGNIASSGLMWSTSYAGGSWLNGVSGSAYYGYVAMAYLASQMLPLSGNPANAQQVGYLAYAIWAIFQPSQVQSWLGAGSQAWACVEQLAQGALSGALKGTYTAASFAGWELLTPISGSQNMGQGIPQEYFEFVPEGGTALMYLLLAGFACFGTMFLKSRRGTSQVV
jgi:hypothetical protein